MISEESTQEEKALHQEKWWDELRLLFWKFNIRFIWCFPLRMEISTHSCRSKKGLKLDVLTLCCARLFTEEAASAVSKYIHFAHTSQFRIKPV